MQLIVGIKHDCNWWSLWRCPEQCYNQATKSTSLVDVPLSYQVCMPYIHQVTFDPMGTCEPIAMQHCGSVVGTFAEQTLHTLPSQLVVCATNEPQYGTIERVLDHCLVGADTVPDTER
jgi:hypothetical protein